MASLIKGYKFAALLAQRNPNYAGFVRLAREFCDYFYKN